MVKTCIIYLKICTEYIFFMQIKKKIKSAEIPIHKRESKRN